MLVVRIFIIVLVLVFSLQSWTKADDINEFEIVGMSIGDSLFKFFTKDEINTALENITYLGNDQKFLSIFLPLKPKQFDYIQVSIETNDKNYLIHDIMLIADYSEKIDKCKIHKEKLINETLNVINFKKRIDKNKPAINIDPTGNTFAYASSFHFEKGGYVLVACYDYSNELYEKHGWFDSLQISASSEELRAYLNN